MLELLGGASGALGIFGALGGAVARFVTAYQQLQVERERNRHELAMLEASAAIEDRRAEQRLAEMTKASEAQLAAIRAKGEADTQVAEQQALGTALQAQLAPTGIKAIDALNSSVRPVLTYWWCLVLYTAAKAALVVALFVGGQLPGAAAVAAALVTPFDQAIIGSMIGFWFVDRALRRAR